MPTQKPFSSACIENQQPILGVLQRVLAERSSVLEIGSGTGQHAAYFPAFLPHLRWQPSDVAAHVAGIELWRGDAGLENVLPCLVLDVLQAWPEQHYDAVFSANTAHIMSFTAVEAMIRGVATVLHDDGVFCLYGPFKQDGKHTSDSNARFDDFLQQRDPASGVRDIADLAQCALTVGLDLAETVEMPVNNKILLFQRR